jgi:hypothetical protein
MSVATTLGSIHAAPYMRTSFDAFAPYHSLFRQADLVFVKTSSALICTLSETFSSIVIGDIVDWRFCVFPCRYA